LSLLLLSEIMNGGRGSSSHDPRLTDVKTDCKSASVIGLKQMGRACKRGQWTLEDRVHQYIILEAL